MLSVVTNSSGREFIWGQTTSDNLYLEPNKILLNLNPPCALILWPSFLFSLAVISHGNARLWKIKQASNSADSPGPCPEPPSTCHSLILAPFIVHCPLFQ